MALDTTIPAVGNVLSDDLDKIRANWGELTALDAAHAALAAAHGATGAVVGTTNAQTLTNKTIVAANNTITTAPSGDLTATELNAALAELQAAITALENATVTVHTGYVSATSLSSGTGEDANYTNIDVTSLSLSAVANCEVHFDGGCGSTTAAATALHRNYAAGGSERSSVCTARLTSTTNLRIACAGGGGAAIYGRWKIIDHGA